MTAFKEGFGVVDDMGLLINTVGETPRAAMVNWLCTERRLVMMNSASDEYIKQKWNEHCGTAQIKRVRMYVQDGAAFN